MDGKQSQEMLYRIPDNCRQLKPTIFSFQHETLVEYE